MYKSFDFKNLEAFSKMSLGSFFYNELKKKDPMKIAMIDYATNEEITYDCLLKVSIKLAKALEKLELKKGDIICIISENNWKYLATIIASFLAGVTVSLLNHDYNAEELTHFLKICRPVLIFCNTKTLENILQLKEEPFFPAKNLITFDSPSCDLVQIFDELLNIEAEDFIPCEVRPEQDVALILTSSGTSGLPKCVMLTHANLGITLPVGGHPDFFNMSDKEITVNYLPFFHVFGCGTGLAAILYGNKQVILNKFNPEILLKVIQGHKITQLYVVPPVLNFLAHSTLVDKYDLSSIKDIINGAAPVGKELLQLIENKLNIESVRQVYGMTETSGAAIMVPLGVKKYGTVGKMIMTCHVTVCDVTTDKELSANQLGEFRVSGMGVMKGYLGDEEAEKNAFDEEGKLKTGDLGYFDEDGYFYIVDRLKDVIKYKGFQVSPVEIENLLLQHSSVKDAAVVGKADDRAGEVPVAFVIKENDSNVTEEDLIKYIKGKVSDHKRLHGGVKFVQEIPKSASGKILRRKLRELF